MTIFAAPSNPWPAATINVTRPRLLATANRVTRLQSRWAAPTTPIGSTGKTWASLQTAWSAGTGNAALAIPWAMKYLATGNGTFATNAYNACSGETYISGTGTSAGSLAPNMRVNQSGIVLDWCYPALSSGQKNTLIGNCQSFTNSARSALQVTGAFDLVGPGNNCAIQNYVFNALAAEGEAGFGSELANIRRVVQNMLELLDESWADGAWRAYEYVLPYNWLTLDAYFTATSDGEATLLSRSQHFQNHGTMATRMLAWDSQSYCANGIYGGYRAPTGQTDAGNADDTDDPWSLAIVSDINRDPVTKWLVDTVLTNLTTPQQGYTTTPPWTHQNSLLVNPTYLAFFYYDDTLTGQSPTATSLGTCAATMPSGTFNFRGGWNIATDLVGNYIAGPFRQNDHDMINLGCLTLRVGSHWLITDDSAYGGAPSTYGPNGANGAAASNEIFGYTMRSSGPSYTPNTTLTTREDRDGSGYNQSNSLPPGQAGTYPLSGTLTDNFRKTFDTGKITAFTDDGNKAVCTSDLSNGFPQMTQALCKVTFVRGASTDLGTVGEWDQFTAPATVGHIRRNFHVKLAMTSLVSLDGAITVQSGSTSAGILTATGTTVYFETGGYRCTIQCVSQLTTIDIIGGSGFEGWYDGYPASEGGSPISNGVNLPYSGNTQQPISQQRVANSNNWIINQFRVSFLTTQASNTNSEMLHIVSVTPAGTPATVYTLTTAKALFVPTPPPPPTPQPPVGNAFDNSLGRVLYILRSANMNTIADQQMVPVSNPVLSAISAIYVTNVSTSMTNSAGGFYSGAGKTGLNLVANTQVYSSLTTATGLLAATLGSDATTNVITSAPYFSLTTPHGAAATADIYLLGADLNVVDAQPPPPPTGAALWISDSLSPGAVSSLDTGRIGYIVAWGGNEYGYAYTYTLSGAPAGLSIDADTGVMSISSPLSAAAYPFTVIVTNRRNTALVANFPYTLTVGTGITVGSPTTGQVLHKTYDPHSGTWGAPTGNDWTTVFNAMQTAIIADQTSAGDGQLRVSIPLHRGVEYDYTKNSWLTGIQYWHVFDTGSGALPILCCTNSTSGADVDKGPLNIGWQGTALGNPAGGIKSHAATIASTNVGDRTITLLVGGDASKIKVGRWHLICSQCIQINGFPPNCMWDEYVRVLSVVGTTVTLDRQLHYAHSQTYYENLSDDSSLGVARIIPFDTGGTGGYTPSDPRSSYRCSFTNMTFKKNPNHTQLVASIHQTQGFIDITYDGCGCLSPNPTQLKHVMFVNSTIGATGEFDKLAETVMVDNCVSGAFNGTQDYSSATGFMYVLYRNSHMAPIIMSPRQIRIMGGSNIDALGDAFLFVPISFSYNGAIMQWDVTNSTLQGSSGTPAWAFAQNPLVGTGTTMGFTLGTDCNWSGNQLQFPSSTVGNSQFENMLVKVFAGMIVSGDNGKTPTTASYGYIDSVTSPGDGTAVWLNIVWLNGGKPTSGTLWLHRWRRIDWSNVTLGTAGGVTTLYNDAGFSKTTVPGQTSYDFPAGLPLQFQT